MKRFYFLSLIICALTFTLDSYCMMPLLAKNRILITPAHRRRCTMLTHLQKRVDALEKQQDIHAKKIALDEKEMAEIKALVNTLRNNQVPVSYENLPRIHDSFSNEYKWDRTRYGNTTH